MSLYFTKDSSDVFDYQFDWTDRLDTGETIVTSNVTVDTGLALNSQSNTTTTVTAFVSSGTDGGTYAVTNIITTSTGRTESWVIYIQVFDAVVGTNTLGTMADEVIARLIGDPARLDRVAQLMHGTSSVDMTLQLDDASNFGQGIVEVGSELMLIKSVDKSSNTLTVYQRGYRGSIARQHTGGDLIRMAPQIPRAGAMRAISDETQSIYPSLFGTDTVDVTPLPMSQQYELPDDAEFVADVRQQDPLGNWQRVKSWEYETNISGFDSGKGVRLPCLVPLYPVQVVYGKRPSPLLGENDPFAYTGLPDSVRDLIIMGAVIRLLPSFDMARLGYQQASSVEGNKAVQPGASSLVVRELKAQYQARLLMEQNALKKQYPTRWHRTR